MTLKNYPYLYLWKYWAEKKNGLYKSYTIFEPWFNGDFQFDIELDFEAQVSILNQTTHF